MKLELLAVPDCPNVTQLRARLDAVLAGRDDVQVTTTVIDTAEQAAVMGMHGSPTLLVDGVDPFAVGGQPTSVSCRIYRDDSGMPVGVPSTDQLRAALAGTIVPAPTDAAPDCCAPQQAGHELLARRTGTAPTDPADRAIHQAILRTFATTGAPVDRRPPPGRNDTGRRRHACVGTAA